MRLFLPFVTSDITIVVTLHSVLYNFFAFIIMKNTASQKVKLTIENL